MTSGRKITEAERRSILRLNWQGLSHGTIARECGCDVQTVGKVVNEAAAAWYEEHRPSWIDRLREWP